MTKRARESSVTFVIQNDHVVVECCGKEYAWTPPVSVNLISLLNMQDIEFSIVHNFEHKAMLDVENLKRNETILRQEINPLKYRKIDDWVVDE